PRLRGSMATRLCTAAVVRTRGADTSHGAHGAGKRCRPPSYQSEEEIAPIHAKSSLLRCRPPLGSWGPAFRSSREPGWREGLLGTRPQGPSRRTRFEVMG